MPKKKNQGKRKAKITKNEDTKPEEKKIGSKLEDKINPNKNKEPEFYEIEKEEINKLNENFNRFLEEDNENIIDENINLEQENEENEDMQEDFSKGLEINDINYIKENLPQKISIYNKTINLNNENNPFIKEMNKIKNNSHAISTKLEFEYEEKEEKEKDSKNNHNGFEEKIKDKINEQYELDDKFIEKQDKIILEKDINIFSTLNYGDKKFKLMTKKKQIKETNEITYYCSLHRTTKYSTKYDKNNKKKKISICNCKIIYNKKTNKYSMINNHSKKCDELFKKKYDNYREINIEIVNYKNFRLGLIEYLKINPMITYHDFLKEALKIYDKNNCSFEIKNNTFSNLYYNWRKESNIFTKFSVFNNKYTNNNEIFLRDYSLKTIYSKSGKKVIFHEHMIFISNYFIKKLRDSEHFYIDGTFVFPKGFKQLIVILYYDNKSSRRFPGLFALINNKTENGYIELFKSVKNIITLENTKILNLKSISTDFELGLISALETVFPGIRKVGCFYHFVRAIKEKFKNLGMLDKKNNNIGDDNNNSHLNILNDIFTLPFSFNNNDYTNVDSLCNKYGKEYPDFINYFKRQWVSFFINGLLNYSYLKKDFRSNSYIENYNRRIKLKLSKYLYGKSKVKISWPLFLYFIRNEEEEYRKENIKYENSLEYKVNYKTVERKNVTIGFNPSLSNKIPQSRKWLKFNRYSCRYDTFFFIYTFAIQPKLMKDQGKSSNIFIDLYNNISNDILNLNDKDLDKGIWFIIDRYKHNYDFLNYNYQEYNTVRQLLDKFEKNDNFCFKYSCIEGCTNCLQPNHSEKYLSPIFVFDNNYINMYNLTGLIYNQLKNTNSVCYNCGYLNGLIIDENIKNYYVTILKVQCPKFILVGFEFSLAEDLYNEQHKLNSLETLNLLSFNRLKNNIELIKNLIINEFTVYNTKYVIKGIICCPFSWHYNGILINLDEDFHLLKKTGNYFYDDRLNNNSIEEIPGNWKNKLNDNYPTILIYIKE